MRPASRDELGQLCRGITKSFVHLETRDAYGTEVELPHWGKWRRGEPDDFAWLAWWLEMLRGHRAAGRTCRRLRGGVRTAERLSTLDPQPRSNVRRRWRGHPIRSPAPAGHGPAARQWGLLRLRHELVLFLHYAGNGTNTFFEVTEDPQTVRTCLEAFEKVWDLATPFRDYRPE